jgi:hypothetical protein
MAVVFRVSDRGRTYAIKVVLVERVGNSRRIRWPAAAFVALQIGLLGTSAASGLFFLLTGVSSPGHAVLGFAFP